MHAIYLFRCLFILLTVARCYFSLGESFPRLEFSLKCGKWKLCRPLTTLLALPSHCTLSRFMIMRRAFFAPRPRCLLTTLAKVPLPLDLVAGTRWLRGWRALTDTRAVDQTYHNGCIASCGQCTMAKKKIFWTKNNAAGHVSPQFSAGSLWYYSSLRIGGWGTSPWDETKVTLK